MPHLAGGGGNKVTTKVLIDFQAVCHRVEICLRINWITDLNHTYIHSIHSENIKVDIFRFSASETLKKKCANLDNTILHQKCVNPIDPNNFV